MHRINYAGGTMLTGSDLAKAVLAYAEALAKAEDSATVEIPVRHVDGSVGLAVLLIGPASQLVAESEESDFPEVIDAGIVQRLTDLTRTVGHTAAVAVPVGSSNHEAADALDVDFDEFTSSDLDSQADR